MNDVFAPRISSTPITSYQGDKGIEDSILSTISKIRKIISSDTRNYSDLHKSIVELQQNNKILDQISHLEENWNGYGAQPIADKIIYKVKSILPNLKKQPAIFPTGRNSIQLEYEKDNG